MFRSNPQLLPITLTAVAVSLVGAVTNMAEPLAETTAEPGPTAAVGIPGTITDAPGTEPPDPVQEGRPDPPPAPHPESEPVVIPEFGEWELLGALQVVREETTCAEGVDCQVTLPLWSGGLVEVAEGQVAISIDPMADHGAVLQHSQRSRLHPIDVATVGADGTRQVVAMHHVTPLDTHVSIAGEDHHSDRGMISAHNRAVRNGSGESYLPSVTAGDRLVQYLNVDGGGILQLSYTATELRIIHPNDLSREYEATNGSAQLALYWCVDVRGHPFSAQRRQLAVFELDDTQLLDGTVTSQMDAEPDFSTELW